MTFKKTFPDTVEDFVRRLMKNQHIPRIYYDMLRKSAYERIRLYKGLRRTYDGINLYWDLSEKYRLIRNGQH